MRATVERGALAPAVPIIVLALFLLGGLIVDGSRDLDGRGQAQAYAEEAARAGAQQIDQTYAGVRLQSYAAASAAVAKYCDQLVANGQLAASDTCGVVATGTTIEPAVVTVHVQMKVPTTILQAFGFGAFTVSADGRAQAVQGISGANQ